MNSIAILTVSLLASVNALGTSSAKTENVESSNGRIIRGDEIDISEAPFTVAILYNKFLKCGGTILSQNFVLATAAPFFSWNSTSQTTYPVIDFNKLDIRAGSSTYSRGGQIVQVNSIDHHPKYNAQDQIPLHDYNVAVITLKSALVLDSTVVPVVLPLSLKMPVGTLVTMTGWGRTELGSESSKLRRAEFALVSDESCMASFSEFFTERFLCVIDPDRHSTASYEDWGGPLVLKDTRILLGVLSTVTKIGEVLNPHLYTNTGNQEISEFIFKQTGL